jgi:hypothetical protein
MVGSVLKLSVLAGAFQVQQQESLLNASAKDGKFVLDIRFDFCVCAAPSPLKKSFVGI